MSPVLAVEGLPYVVAPGVGAIDFFPGLAELVVDFADIRDVVFRIVRVDNMGCGRDVVVPRAFESSAAVVLLPVPLVQPSFCIFPLSDVFAQGVLMLLLAFVNELV